MRSWPIFRTTQRCSFYSILWLELSKHLTEGGILLTINQPLRQEKYLLNKFPKAAGGSVALATPTPFRVSGGSLSDPVAWGAALVL